MLIDLHMHESTHSADSSLHLHHMVQMARQRGLEGICITDHDSMGLRQQAAEYAKATGFPIFVGVEYFSLQGDIVAFGLESLPDRRLDAQTFIDLVHRAGGVCFSAHPFRNNNRGLGEHLLTLRGLDGIEAFNASTDYEANLWALRCCNSLGIQPLGTSDCHVSEKIGRFATKLPGFASTLEELIALLRRGKAVPVGYQNGRYVELTEGTADFGCTVSRWEHNEISLQRDEVFPCIPGRAARA